MTWNTWRGAAPAGPHPPERPHAQKDRAHPSRWHSWRGAASAVRVGLTGSRTEFVASASTGSTRSARLSNRREDRDLAPEAAAMRVVLACMHVSLRRERVPGWMEKLPRQAGRLRSAAAAASQQNARRRSALPGVVSAPVAVSPCRADSLCSGARLSDVACDCIAVVRCAGRGRHSPLTPVAACAHERTPGAGPCRRTRRGLPALPERTPRPRRHAAPRPEAWPLPLPLARR